MIALFLLLVIAAIVLGIFGVVVKVPLYILDVSEQWPAVGESSLAHSGRARRAQRGGRSQLSSLPADGPSLYLHGSPSLRT
jgi:hypothetical protein